MHRILPIALLCCLTAASAEANNFGLGLAFGLTQSGSGTFRSSGGSPTEYEQFLSKVAVAKERDLHWERNKTSHAPRLFKLAVRAFVGVRALWVRMEALDKDEAARKALFDEIAAGKQPDFPLAFTKGKYPWQHVWSLRPESHADIEAIQADMKRIAGEDMQVLPHQNWYVERPVYWIESFRLYSANGMFFGFKDPEGPRFGKFSTFVMKLADGLRCAVSNLESALMFWAAVYELDGDALVAEVEAELAGEGKAEVEPGAAEEDLIRQ